MLLKQALGNGKKWVTIHQRIVLLITEWKLLAFRKMATSGWLKTKHFNKTDHRSLNKLFHYRLPPCLLLTPRGKWSLLSSRLEVLVSSSIIRKGSTRVATRDGWEVVRWKLHVKNENREEDLLVTGWMPCLQHHPHATNQPTHTAYRWALPSQQYIFAY